MPELNPLRQLLDQGLIRPLDYHLGAVLHDAGEADPRVLLAAALASRRLADGDVCLALDAVAGRPLIQSGGQQALSGPPVAPRLEDWLAGLRASAFVSDGDRPAPLALEGTRLYLGRYQAYEAALGSWVASRAAEIPDRPDAQRLRRELQRVFPDTPTGTGHDQRVAAAVAALHAFCVISGGPGTGKTTTVAKVLALLLRLHGPLRVLLAAPTGKAAARLGEALRALKPGLELSLALADCIPERVHTLHRLLGLPGDGGSPRHHAGNPLHCDLLVVDEASMVDLPLMARLVDALPVRARLVLLGDKDQLASVEAGSVLGDICAAPAPGYGPGQTRLLNAVCAYAGTALSGEPAPMQDAMALLSQSYRFDATRGIGRLARAVKAGDAQALLNCLGGDSPELSWRPAASAADWRALIGLAVQAHAECLRAPDAQTALNALSAFRVLCALRADSHGVAALNAAVEKELARRGLIAPGKPHYPGRPIMIGRNDYALQLFNGDVGLVWRDPADDRLRAFFQQADGGLRGYALSRLPQHETVYAMTVHKSQGSEFDQVMLVLPGEPSPLVGRELLYTGITRARQRVILVAGERVLRAAVDQHNRRASGLRERIWGTG